jgi:hypothetical protein
MFTANESVYDPDVPIVAVVAVSVVVPKVVIVPPVAVNVVEPKVVIVPLVDTIPLTLKLELQTTFPA